MWKYNIKVKVVILTILSVCVVAMNSYAHSGRTDSNGGHKDNKNKSGLVVAVDKLKKIKGIDFIEFDNNDIVRNPIVSKIIDRFKK